MVMKKVIFAIQISIIYIVMKKTVFALLLGVAAVLTSCDPTKKNQTLDPHAQLNIHMRAKLSTRAGGYEDQHLSPRDLLEQANHFRCYPQGSNEIGTRSIEANEKDFDKLMIKMWGDDIVRADTVTTYWRDARDLVICNRQAVIIGYIPQHVRDAAFEKILAAEKEKNYDLIYKIFQEAFEAVPCTPEEWAELKAQGRN